MVEPSEQLCPVSQTVKPGTPTDDDSEKLDIDLRIHRKRLSKLLDEAHHQLEVNMCDKFKRWKQEKAKEPERPEEESKSVYIILISGAPGVGKSTFSKALLAKPLDYFLADITVETLWAVEQDEPLYPEDITSNSPGAKQKLISGVYRGDRDNNSIQVLKMEHSALQGPNSQWNLEVKYRVRENKTSAKPWVNIWNFYPDAKVELKQNEIELAISSPNEDHEFAVFGTPEKEDKKRMQMAIFGEKPKQGKHWPIFVTLFDDTTMAFERVCEREESKGRQLLTTLAGLFVSNSYEDIKIDITALEDGWKMIGSHLMKIKSKDAWNSPENSTDFPWCVFEIAHVDKTKQTFVCGIQASHLNDTAETELLALFEQGEENEEHLNSQNLIPPPELTITEDNFIVLEKALDKLADATRNGWESLARALTFTRGKKGGLFDLLLHWKQEQTETFVFFLMLVFIVGCLAATRFVTPHLLEVAFDLFLMLVPFVACLTGTPFVTPHLLKVEETEGKFN